MKPHLAAIVLSLLLGFSARALIYPSSVGVDDAQIFFVYAKNFLSGHGLVFSIGMPPVEGFTSIGWLLVCIFGFSITDQPENLLLAVNCLLVAYALTFFAQTLLKIFGGDPIPLFGLLLAWVIADPGFWGWTYVSLMDTGLWCATVLLSLSTTARMLSSAKPAWRVWTASIAILPIVRPEGVAWGALLIVLTGILKRGTLRGIRTAAVLLGTTVALLTIIRVAYFDALLPNTFYAKHTTDLLFQVQQGVQYLIGYFVSNPILVGFLHFLGGYAWIRAYRDRSSGNGSAQFAWITLCLVGWLFCLSVYLLLGGDHFPENRLLHPFRALLFGAALPVVIAPPRLFSIRAALPALALTLLLASALLRWPSLTPDTRMVEEFWLAEQTRARGAQLDEVFANHTNPPRVAAVTVGGLAFEYSGPVIDLMGLTLPEMAHSGSKVTGPKNHAAFSPEVFFEIQPEVVITAPFVCSTASFPTDLYHPALAIPLKGLLQSERFQDLYQAVRVETTNGSGLCFFADISWWAKVVLPPPSSY